MTQISLSKIIAGTMNWGVWSKKLSSLEMQHLMNHCLENNITTFDHADIYGGYTTEAEFGSAFRESSISRTSIQLITKCGIQSVSENRKTIVKHYDYSENHIIRSLENSLKNLQTDYIDVLLLHRPSPLIEADVVANAIEKLKKEGKILGFGLSNFSPLQTQLIQKSTEVLFNQIQFSATHLEPMSNGELAFMQTQNIIPMAWNPLGSVFKFEDEKSKRVKTVADELTKKYDVPLDVILFSWVLKHPAKILPVFGTTDKNRISNLTKALTLNMDLEDWFAIWEANLGRRVD
jgi:predicted oxidoreductase